MRALLGILALLAVAPSVPAPAFERIGEVVVGPVVAMGVDAQPVATFEVPEGYRAVFAALEARRVPVTGVLTVNEWMLASPTGADSMIGNGNALAGFYICLPEDGLVCEDRWDASVHRSHNLPAVGGVWRVEYRGANTAEHVFGVYASR